MEIPDKRIALRAQLNNSLQQSPSPEPMNSLVDAIFHVTGRRVAISTALRWALSGTGGVRLTSWKLGGRRCTTDSAVREFIAATTAASNVTAPASRGQKHHKHRSTSAHEAAMRQLDAEGL